MASLLGLVYDSDSDEEDSGTTSATPAARGRELSPSVATTAAATSLTTSSSSSASTTTTATPPPSALIGVRLRPSRSSTPPPKLRSSPAQGSPQLAPRKRTFVEALGDGVPSMPTNGGASPTLCARRIRLVLERGDEDGASSSAGAPPNFDAGPSKVSEGGIEASVAGYEAEALQLLRPWVKNDGSVEIPPEPSDGEVDAVLQAKIEKWTDLRQKGRTFNDQLMRTHKFGNPAIMSKLIDFLGLDEHGSNIPANVFDPKGLPKNLYYDALADAQKEAAEKGALAAQVALLAPPSIPGVFGVAEGGSSVGSLARTVAGAMGLSTRFQAQQFSSTETENGAGDSSNATGTKRRSKWDQQR